MEEPVDYIRLQDAYGGKFVAMRNGEVIASAETHGILVRVLRENNLDSEDIVFEYIRPKDRFFAYRISSP